MHEASAWFGKCSIGVIVTNVKRNARVVFDGHVSAHHALEPEEDGAPLVRVEACVDA